MRATLFFRNWTSLITILLSLAVIVILLIAHFTIGSRLEGNTQTNSTNINFPEPPTKEKDYLDFTCAELKTEFNSERGVDLAQIILDVMTLRGCNIKPTCISDAKFEFFIEQFNKGVISAESFAELNEEYRSCE